MNVRPQTKNIVQKITLAIFTMVILTSLYAQSQTVSAAAGIYEKINFQGKLVNNDGTNVTDGSYTLTFTLYDASSAGTNLWTEDQTLTVTDGIFHANLGAVSAFGSTLFDNDNLFLGVKINSGTELSPRIRFTASPYAMNAKKVNGLNVTNTTGTLTIPSGATIAFSGANSVTLTSSGTTTLTLPTTGTLATLAGNENFTNKTIGSTGLTFSGATTDITTGTNEDLAIVPNGTGKVGIGTSTPVTKFDVAGLTLNTDADGTIGAANFTTSVTKNDTNTRQFYGVKLKPTFNTGGSNTTTTFNVLDLDTTNTAVTGLTVNLMRLAYGGTNRFLVSDAGAVSASPTTASGNAYGITANSLTSGNGLIVQSSGAALAGNLGIFSATGNNAGVTGNILKVENTGASSAATTLMLSNAGTGNGLRINDDGTDTDSTPVIVDAAGNMALGATTASYKLDVNGALRLQATSAPTAALGVMYFDTGLSKFRCSENGSSFVNCIGSGGGSSAWDALTAPSTNLSLAMASNTSTFTYGATTSTANLFNLTDTTSNTGTGYLMNLTTASGSTLKPLHISAAGIEALTVNASGNVGIGTTNPGAKLDINTSSSTPGGFNIGQQLSGVQSGNSATYTSFTNLYTSTTSSVTGGAFPEAFNIYNDTFSTNDGVAQYVYGNMTQVTTHSGDRGYGYYARSRGTGSTGGTQYGIYLDMNDADITGYGVYQVGASSNYFAGNVGLGTSAPATTLDVAGLTLNTDADGKVMAENVTGSITKNDTATRQFYGLKIKPTLNTGASNTNTTFNVIDVDTTNTATTGLTSNLFKLAYGGTQRLLVGSSGDISATAGTSTTQAFNFQANSVTTSTGFGISANALTSGDAFNISSTSTSFTGNLGQINWNPTAGSIATGDMLRLNVNTASTVGNFLNLVNNGTSVLSASQNAFTTSLPASFTAPGDIAASYDMVFTNDTASAIRTSAPFTIDVGEAWESNDLTLKTYNAGKVVMSGAMQLTGISAPTAAAGMMYYDSGAAKFKCSENGSSFTDCISAGGSPALSSITSATSSPTALANANFAQTWNWGTLTTQTGMTFGGGTAMTTGSILTLGGATFTTAASTTGSVQNITFTDSSANTTNTATVYGLNVSSTISTTGAGSKVISPVNVNAPTVSTCTTGACTWNGVSVSTVSSGPLATLTNNGLNVNATGIANGTLNGLNISGITAAGGTETGIKIGAGWDTGISITTSAAESGLTVTAGAAPTVDMVTLSNTGQAVATAGVSALQITYVGGAANVESSASRIDLTPGGTSGAVWNGLRVVTNTTGPATGVTENGLKVEGPTTGGAGTYNGLNIVNVLPTTGGTANGINITGSTAAAGTENGLNIANITAGAGTETAIKTGTGWDVGISVAAGGITITAGGETISAGGLTLSSSSTSQITQTSTATGSYYTVTANSITSSTGQQISNTGLTTGHGFGITGGTAMTTGDIFQVLVATKYVHTTTETGSIGNWNYTDSSTNASGTSTTNGLLLAPTVNITSGAGARNINGLTFTPTLTACSAGTCAVNGVNINGATAASGTTLYGMNVATITGGAGTERGVVIGTGWDTSLDFGNSTSGTAIASSGIIRFARSSTASNTTCAGATTQGLTFVDDAGTRMGHFCGDTTGGMELFYNAATAATTDLAENYSDVTNTLQPGELVMFDLSYPKKAVVKADAAHQNLLMGIVSTEPGMLLSGISESNGKTDLVNPKPIALKGRVPTLVSTENGPISVGDSLTISSTPGVAMKATSPGMIVGQALEAYTGASQGSIEVFLNPGYYPGTGTTILAQASSILPDPAPATASATTLNSLKDLDIQGSATLSANLNVGGNTLIEGILNVIDSITTNNFIATGWADFMGRVIFRDDVAFLGRPTFNKDTAGSITIPKGQKSVTVTFTKEYANAPVVVASISQDSVADPIQQKKLEDYLALNDVKHAVVRKSTKGFTILLTKPQTEDITFSWVAMAVDSPTAVVAGTSSAILSPTPAP